MAWTFIANRGTNTTKASGTTLGVAPTATIAAGRILVVRCVSDDTTGDGPTHAVSDTGGNTYDQMVFSSGSTSATTTTVSIHVSRLTTQLTTGSTVTLTTGATVNAKIIELTEFSVATGFTYALGGSNSAGGSSASPSVTLSGLSLIARLWVGLVGAEGLNGDTFTEDADYSNTITIGTTGNPTASNLKGSGGNRIATQTSDTYAPTITSRDWRVVLAAINETAIPAAELAADVSGTATAGTASLTTSITMEGVSASIGSAEAELTTYEVDLAASISGQANTTGFLTIGADEIFGHMSNYLETQLVNHLFRTGSYTKPTELWVSLHTAAIAEDGTGTEVTGNNYSRAQHDPGDANWTAVGNGGTDALTSNTTAIVFPTPSDAWGQITHAGIWDAGTAGNLLFYCTLNAAFTVNAGDGAPQITAGGLQININVPPISEFIELAASVTATATTTADFTVPGTIWWEDDFSTGTMDSVWEAGGDGFVWNDIVDFNWHRSTENPYLTDTYSARGHYTSTDATSPLSAATLTDAAGGGAGGTRFVRIVIVRPNTPTGWLTPFATTETSRSVAASRNLKVTSPASGLTFYYYNVYAGTVTGDTNLKLQNASPIAVGTDWTEPDSGLVNLGSFPSISGSDSSSWTRQFIRWPNSGVGMGTHLFSRYYLYLKTPETGGSLTIQRKLHRYCASQYNGDVAGWEAVLVAEDYDGTGSQLRYGRQAGGAGETGAQTNAFTDVYKLAYDTWYRIETEEILNTVGVADGTVRLWVDGVLKGENTAYQIRYTDTREFGQVIFGDQAQRSGTEDIDEIRYFARIVISDSAVGP